MLKIRLRASVFSFQIMTVSGYLQKSRVLATNGCYQNHTFNTFSPVSRWISLVKEVDWLYSPTLSIGRCRGKSWSRHLSYMWWCYTGSEGDKKGQDTIFCYGSCQARIHRRCVSLTNCAFEKLVDLSMEFFCPTCRLTTLESLVCGLQNHNYVLFRRPPQSLQLRSQEAVVYSCNLITGRLAMSVL